MAGKSSKNNDKKKITPGDAWNAALQGGKARGITRHHALQELAHACCYEASRRQWNVTDLEAFIEAFIKKKKKEWDARWDALAPFNAYIDALKAVEAYGVNHCVAYNIAAAWSSEVANNYPGKVTVMEDFIEKKRGRTIDNFGRPSGKIDE
jgi:hypothetical protein